jgi:hypothetical protein
MLEFDDAAAHAQLIDEIRSSSIFSVPYFTLEDLLVGEQAAWLEPSQCARNSTPPVACVSAQPRSRCPQPANVSEQVAAID